MAVTTSTRMGATRWSAAGDPLTRAQVDATHANFESRAAGFLADTFAARPAAAAANARFVYEATDTGALYWSTGTRWLPLSGAYDRSTATVTVVNNAAEADLYSVAIAAGDFAAAGAVLHLALAGDFLINDSGSSRAPVLRVKLGATTLFTHSFTLLNPNASRGKWRLDVDVTAGGSAVQRARMLALNAAAGLTNVVAPGGFNNGIVNLGDTAATEDMTAAKTLKATVELGFAHALYDLRRTFATLDLVR